jgi:hypothetical protein
MTPTCKGLGRLLGGHSFKACYDEESVERKDADGAEYARTEKTVVGIWCRWCGQPAPLVKLAAHRSRGPDWLESEAA